MRLPIQGKVLDLGCGYGPIGIVAAKLEPNLQVWMTDINFRAITFAKENALRNGVENVHIIRGSLYKPVVGQIFDVILSNPPFSVGFKKAIKPIIEGARKRLILGGSLQVVFRLNKGGRSLSKLLEQHFGTFEVLGKKSGYRVLSAELR